MKMTIVSRNEIQCDDTFAPMMRYFVEIDFGLTPERSDVTGDEFAMEMGRALLTALRTYNGSVA
jgi:hypothetical protein